MGDDSTYIALGDDHNEEDVIKEIKPESSNPNLSTFFQSLNRNVKFILIIVAFSGLSESMGFGAALSAYLYLSTGKSNIRIGFLESCMGLTKLLTALPMVYKRY